MQRSCWHRIRRKGEPEFHLRDMFRSHQSRFWEVAMMPVVGLLQDQMDTSVQGSEKRSRDAPPDLFEVNPELLAGMS